MLFLGCLGDSGLRRKISQQVIKWIERNWRRFLSFRCGTKGGPLHVLNMQGKATIIGRGGTVPKWNRWVRSQTHTKPRWQTHKKRPQQTSNCFLALGVSSASGHEYVDEEKGTKYYCTGNTIFARVSTWAFSLHWIPRSKLSPIHSKLPRSCRWARNWSGSSRSSELVRANTIAPSTTVPTSFAFEFLKFHWPAKRSLLLRSKLLNKSHWLLEMPDR